MSDEGKEQCQLPVGTLKNCVQNEIFHKHQNNFVMLRGCLYVSLCQLNYNVIALVATNKARSII